MRRSGLADTPAPGAAGGAAVLAAVCRALPRHEDHRPRVLVFQGAKVQLGCLDEQGQDARALVSAVRSWTASAAGCSRRRTVGAPGAAAPPTASRRPAPPQRAAAAAARSVWYPAAATPSSRARAAG